MFEEEEVGRSRMGLFGVSSGMEASAFVNPGEEGKRSDEDEEEGNEDRGLFSSSGMIERSQEC